MSHAQQNLFYRPPQAAAFARVTDPSTSKAAARSVEENLPELEKLCLDTIRRAGQSGMTTEELAGWLHLSLVTISPRMKPLQNKGLIVAGEKRANRSGRLAIAWRAK